MAHPPCSLLWIISDRSPARVLKLLSIPERLWPQVALSKSSSMRTFYCNAIIKKRLLTFRVGHPQSGRKTRLLESVFWPHKQINGSCGSARHQGNAIPFLNNAGQLVTTVNGSRACIVARTRNRRPSELAS